MLRALGLSRTVTENEIAKKVARVSNINDPHPAAGTFETQLMKVAKASGLNVEEFRLHQPHAAVCALRGHILMGRPVILCVDNDSHWVLAIGLLGPRLIVADTADPEITLSYDEQELAARWGAAGDPVSYYGLAIHKGRRK